MAATPVPVRPEDHVRTILLDIERGGHRIQLDFRVGHYRVTCNGVVNALFSAEGMGDVRALFKAVELVSEIEANAIKNPKPGYDVNRPTSR